MREEGKEAKIGGEYEKVEEEKGTAVGRAVATTLLFYSRAPLDSSEEGSPKS